MTGNTQRVAAVLFAVLSACAPSFAQKPDGETTLDADTLITLHEAGIPAAELERLFDRHGVGTFEEGDIARLRRSGIAEALVRRVEIQVKRRGDSPLSVTDVVSLSEAGVLPGDIIASIRATESRFDLTIDDLVELARRRVPADVIKEMRARGATTEAAAKAVSTITLEDIGDMAQAGFAADEILARIRAADARFEVQVDDILVLTRKQVPEAVLKEVWARRRDPAPPLPGALPEGTLPASAKTGPAASPGGFTVQTLRVHLEASGGFSISVPESFALFQETRNRNSLVSFTDRRIEDPTQVADAEIQVLRYRSMKPERLVPRNLEAAGNQFLTTLRANYAKKGLELSHTEGTRGFLSGLPSAEYRVSSTASDGTTHEGRLAVTFVEDQVFVLSFAVRSDLFPTVGPVLQRCIGSFTLERETPRLVVGGDPVTSLFEHWRLAVTQRDYARYRTLLPTGKDDQATREAFSRLADRFADPQLRLALDHADPAKDLLTITVKVIRPEATESVVLTFAQAAGAYYLQTVD
jgi:hypothetical protein